MGVYDFITKPEQAEVMLKRVENGLKIGEMIHFNEFIKLELLMAKKLQKYLFPEPEFENEFISLINWSRPLSDIGGDLYDYVNFRNGNVVFFVGDVTGHSISAALYTAIVKMVFRNALKIAERPDEIIANMNRELFGNLPIETFVTMFLGLVDIEKGLLHYTNAGHPKPFLLKNGTARELMGNDSFLGPIQNVTFQTFSIPLDEFDTLFVYTDGILDILDKESNPRGREMLLEVLNDRSADVMSKFLRAQERLQDGKYKITDDCTMMMVSKK
jgi:phosphoserine phosphatase RsbU/P